MSWPRRAVAGLRLIGVGAALILPISVLAPSAADAHTAPVRVSLAVSDGRGIVHAPTPGRYAATVTNAGETSVHGTLVLLAPAHADWSAVPPGKVTGPEVSWSVTVRAGASITRSAVTMRGGVPRRQLAVIVEATLVVRDRARDITLRDVDIDQIGGITTASAMSRTEGLSRTSAGSAWHDNRLLWTLGGLAVLVALSAMALGAARLRRKATGTHARHPATGAHAAKPPPTPRHLINRAASASRSARHGADESHR